MSISVAIVEDEKAFRESLAYLIDACPELACVAACASAEEAGQQLPAINPDVVLLDIELPGISGLEYVPLLRASLPDAQIIMLTVVEDPEKVFRALRRGASGYLRKVTPLAELPERIQEVMNGGSPMSPEIARLVIKAFQTPLPDVEAAQKLSPRQLKVVELMAQGYDPKEIAVHLGLSPDTVKTHCRSIYRKLQVNNREAAITALYPAKTIQITPRKTKNQELI
jgi:DNA-binding NarL/FixJ family response regulator